MAHSAIAAGPRVLSKGKQPADQRLQPLKNLRSGYFPFKPPETSAEWDQRSTELRRRILVSTGLWPMPEKTPANAVIHGKVERDGFTVEKVYFESYPGHFVTGLLFRPVGKSGKLPGVLCPHGHGGRLQDYGEKKIKELIAVGAERFEASGRFPKLARCATLARMGCVTFIFDMLGYADSGQISYQVAHRYADERPGFDSQKSWGLYGAQAELRLQSIMGVQTYNSIRALDFLASLPDVDEKRLGVTGGSGGGTQTILLGAIDPRPAVSFPNGMVSTAMQGGCTCENCSLLRVGTGNIELAGLFAPKPLGMTGANDWTKDIATKGLPELKKLYSVLGVPNNVMSVDLRHFPHNYNYVTRAIMYRWFNKHLKLGLEDPFLEEDYKLLTSSEMAIWNNDHPKPPDGDKYERSLMKWLDDASNKQLAALKPTDEKSLAKYRTIYGGAFDTIIGKTLSDFKKLDREKVIKKQRGSYLEFGDLLRNKTTGSEIPTASLLSTKTDWNKKVVLWIDGSGKSGLFNADGKPIAAVQKLLDAGTSVISADLMYQGEFLADGKPLAETPKVDNPRQFAGFTLGYNDSVFAQRVHDILTLVSFVRSYKGQPESIQLVGVNGAGPLVAAALVQSEGTIDRTIIETDGFRFKSLTSYRDPRFLSGAVKYGDLPGLLSLAAPQQLLILGEGGKVPGLVAATYKAAGKQGNVTASTAENVDDKDVDWLLK